MQSFSDLFASNRLLAIGLVLAAIAVILAVGIALFRLAFGRRLHMSGGRTRQPRLGVVDAFDLDRQRQLVLIRRDNVEHLLMIGGPNDVLVEAAIVRAPATLGARDKDNGFGPSVGIPVPAQPPVAALPPAAPVLPAAASVPAGGPEGGSGLPVPAPLAEPRMEVQAEPARATPSSEPGPTVPVPMPTAPAAETRLPPASTLPAAGPRPTPPAPRAATSLPPRPAPSSAPRPSPAMPAPRPAFSRATPVAPAAASGTEPRPAGRVEPSLGRSQPDAATTVEKPSSESSRDMAPSLRFPPPRPATRSEESEPAGGSGASPIAAERNAPPPRSAPDQPRPSTASPPPRPLPPRPPAPAPSRTAVPSLGSLEEEMAKLLGRPVPPPEGGGTGS